MKKKRIIIILIFTAFLFWVKQAHPLEGPEYKAEGLRDPFREDKIEIKAKEKLEEQIEITSLPGVVIQGIVWGGTFPQAIVNNKVVKIGDTIGQAKVMDISKNGIILLQENKKYKLSAPSVVQLEALRQKRKGGTNEEKF